MSHFQVFSNHTQEPASLQDHSPAGTEGQFNARLVESLLVFWPAKLVDLSYLTSDDVSAKRGQGEVALLVGYIVPGHPHEIAALVIGTARARCIAAARCKIESKSLAVLGILYDTTDGIDAKHQAYGGSPVWISAVPRARLCDTPAVFSVRLGGGAEAIQDATSCAVGVVQYTVPNSRMMQYFSLESLRLAPVSGMKLVSFTAVLLGSDPEPAQLSSRMAAYVAPSAHEQKFLRLLMLDPVHWRSLKDVEPHRNRMPRGTCLRRSIELINRLQHQYAHLASSEIKKASANGGPCRADQESPAQRPIVVDQLHLLGRVLTLVALGVQKALRYPLLRSAGLSLVSMSACARQLDTRISQLVVAPRLASRLRQLRKQQKLGTHELAAPYIGLWNAIWLIANDVILGHAASVLLVQNAAMLAGVGRGSVERYLVDGVFWLLSWLESWPVGLKLNTELSLFFSDAYASLTSTWHSQGLAYVLPRLEALVVATAVVGRWMGVTMVLCVMQDVVSICTLHITMFYTLSSRTLRAFVYVLSALFDVFRGKKRNALRGGRLDDASYELDQLVLGTLLFTLMTFLMPTVYVYYLAFGVARFGVVALEVGVIETCLGLLNHLPLFALMLRIKDPHRLPAGVWLQELEPPSPPLDVKVAGEMSTARFRLRSRALAMGDIFEGYGEHVGGLLEVPSMLLRCLLGQPLRRTVT
ncbi:N-acetylglucosaminyltransferase complex, subunit PIG-Q/GPI1 [Moesziomyces antarcticus T-34]|uniref:N-acetylglucosaminyltransferase complex, subunit PIG-Q/GPI1 n=1 Tax=Pseudozyma antarctica (strain T-34) TaxID=1151754 RepID=M9M0M2_PSEA3|nr:N-acetylglucosaminyltransferase complex, subunit PIG-Q/GPI1 [Moesziomyces antarcticus T-34]